MIDFLYHYKMKVIRVVDGDTIYGDVDLGFNIHHKMRVRLYGVNTPESRTKDLKEKVVKADIIIAAIGKPNFVTADMVKEGAVVVDVGTTRVADASKKNGWALKGDVDFENVAPKCSFITPVPGGVGPMTIASLMINTLRSMELRGK